VFPFSILILAEAGNEAQNVQAKEPIPIPKVVEPETKREPEEPELSRTEATPTASIPPDSVASFTYENTPEVEFPPAKRKRGRPAKIRPPVVFTEPGTPINNTDPQSLVTPTALPQLIADGDENAPVEIDQAGESKVTPIGYLAGGREYALKTFTIIGHGEKLFMLATEVARLTGYRDSYLFFLRNRTLRKVVTTQTEKEDLISQDVIPFSYRSRQISVVTARSVFMQFGHRVIANGQRIRDDYFEERARKDHHIETHNNEARELRHQAALAAATAAMNANNAHNSHLPLPAPVAIASSMSHSDIHRPREYPLPKAKPPIFGAPWHEQYQPLTASLMLEKGQAVMRYNTLIAGERKSRTKMWKEWWTPSSAREPTQAEPQQTNEGSGEQGWNGGYHG
jgi:Chromatin remodelling complex Rsc7/Swp82 subunit